MENAIILETHVTGWHCIRTEHRHLTVDYLRKTVKIKTASSEFETELEAKKSYGIETTIRPEHRSSAKLKDMLDSRGIKISILTCDKIIREIFENNLQEYCLK